MHCSRISDSSIMNARSSRVAAAALLLATLVSQSAGADLGPNVGPDADNAASWQADRKQSAPLCKEVDRCPDPCPQCLPPACPQPVCPPLPPIPPCPTPVVNLTCPQPKALGVAPRCADVPCPACPTCPPSALHSPPKKTRPFGYEDWPSWGTYKFHSQKSTWFAANRTCFEDGAHLFIPDSKAELDTVKSMMKKNEVLYIHIGFHDNDKESKYVSVTGTPMNEFQSKMWHPSQPEGGTDENCAVMYQNGEMHDYPCNKDVFGFVCEMP